MHAKETPPTSQLSNRGKRSCWQSSRQFPVVPGGSAILKQVQPIPAMPWRLFLFLPAAIGQTPGPGPYDLVAVQLLEEAGVSTATPS